MKVKIQLIINLFELFSSVFDKLSIGCFDSLILLGIYLADKFVLKYEFYKIKRNNE